MERIEYEEVKVPDRRNIRKMASLIGTYSCRLVRVNDARLGEFRGRLNVSRKDSFSGEEYGLIKRNGEEVRLRYGDLESLEINMSAERRDMESSDKLV